MDVERFAASPVGRLARISGMDGRFAIAYEHVAFLPDPLSDEPLLQSETWHAVSAANRALARLDQASRQIPNPHLLRQPTLRREAQSTSALEGTFAPLEQVLAADASEGERSKELNEVLNYVVAATLAFSAVQEERPITVGLLESTHAELVRGTDADTQDAGRVRTTQVAIGSSTGAIEDARFVPMPPGVPLRAALDDLVAWIRATDRKGDPVVSAALAHYQFETLHPFNDGNGRLGRLLIVLQLMQFGLVTEPLLSVSPWFEARRTEYQDRLADVSATGDWDGWVRFFALGIESSARDTAERVDRLLAVHAAYVRRLQEHGVSGLARDIVDILIGEPVLTASLVRDRFGVSSQGAGKALQRLLQLGVLEGPVGQYKKQYLAADVWHALVAPVGNVPTAEAPIRAAE
jgi:Fic family protein